MGPSIEYLRTQGKSWKEIIDSASKPGGGDLGSGVFYNVGSFVHWVKQMWQGKKTSKKVGLEEVPFRKIFTKKFLLSEKNSFQSS